MLPGNWPVVAMYVFVVVTFALLDQFSISLGDDYGYMFTDTRLHGGDGERVTSVADCWRTQLDHYFTTNGRFIVHLLTQVFVNIVPLWVYKVLNALVFGTVWLFLCRLGARSSAFGFRRGAVTWAFLWLLMPKPGLVMLSLTAFSLNYMWCGAACLAFLWYYTRSGSQWAGCRFVLLCVLAFVSGFSQESYSLPLSGAVVLTPLLTRSRPTRRQCVAGGVFLLGALLCAIAPGNLNHLEQGGGLESAGLTHKATQMLGALLMTPMTPLACAMTIYAVVSPGGCKAFIRSNLVFFIALVLALVFDALSFTSVRQLYSASFLSMVMLLRLPVWHGRRMRRYGFAAASALAVGVTLVLSGAYVLRQRIYRQHQAMLELAEKNAYAAHGAFCITWTDVRQAPYNSMPQLWRLLGRFAPDPWERSEFHIPFNRQVLRVMSRRISPIGDPKALKATLPLPPDRLRRTARLSDTVPIDSRYAVTAWLDTGKVKPPLRCEGFKRGDTVYYVIPIDHE